MYVFLSCGGSDDCLSDPGFTYEIVLFSNSEENLQRVIEKLSF